MSFALQLRIAAGEDSTEDHFLHGNPDHGRAVPSHQDHPMRSKGARQRLSLFGPRYDQIGVAEFVTLIPEWDHGAHRRAQMIDRLQRGAGNAERHDRTRMMVADGMHVGARLVDAAMDDALAIEKSCRRNDRLRIEREFENVRWFDQFRTA